IARLSSLLRMSLENTRVQTVTLRQELEFLQRYLEIQKTRFGDKLQFKTDTEAATLDAVIPNLILQPAVENAILHGIAQKTAPGTVQITARVREHRLELEVRDDGPGFEISSSGPPKEGIGLTNTRVRLARHYGMDYQMVLKSERGQGVTVNMVLPFHVHNSLNPESS
ncbi:MAG TPA: histidine kinase, partial [Candidatus Didemnitutus sp.]|nr:histidine kinase [Candidatus Didemnitutus sp.]